MDAWTLTPAGSLEVDDLEVAPIITGPGACSACRARVWWFSGDWWDDNAGEAPVRRHLCRFTAHQVAQLLDVPAEVLS